jgi:transposase
MPKPILSDDLWAKIEPMIPKSRKNRHKQYAGRKPSDARRVITGIIFVLKTGIPWNALPATELFPSGTTCRRRLRRWHRAGVWNRLLRVLLAELNAEKGIDWRRAIVDSSSIRALGGGRKTGPNPTDRARPGSKHHVVTDAKGIPLATILTGANRHDVTQLLPLLDKIPPVRGRRGKPRRRPDIVQGDRAYDSESHRVRLKKRASNRS